jgi:hypothetical protein
VALMPIGFALRFFLACSFYACRDGSVARKANLICSDRLRVTCVLTVLAHRLALLRGPRPAPLHRTPGLLTLDLLTLELRRQQQRRQQHQHLSRQHHPQGLHRSHRHSGSRAGLPIRPVTRRALDMRRRFPNWSGGPNCSMKTTASFIASLPSPSNRFRPTASDPT